MCLYLFINKIKNRINMKYKEILQSGYTRYKNKIRESFLKKIKKSHKYSCKACNTHIFLYFIFPFNSALHDLWKKFETVNWCIETAIKGKAFMSLLIKVIGTGSKENPNQSHKPHNREHFWYLMKVRIVWYHSLQIE